MSFLLSCFARAGHIADRAWCTARRIFAWDIVNVRHARAARLACGQGCGAEPRLGMTQPACAAAAARTSGPAGKLAALGGRLSAALTLGLSFSSRLRLGLRSWPCERATLP